MRQRPFLLLTLILVSSHAFAQGTQTAEAGYISCPVGQGHVYLYQSMRNFDVLASPRCEEKVEILGRDDRLGGYLRVRTADGKEGYVPQAHVSATPPARPRLTVPEPPRAVPAGQAPILAGPLSQPRSSFGYDLPLLEVFGGYSYMNMDTNGLSTRRAVNGWTGSLALNLTSLLAAEGSVSGHYKNVDFSGIVPGANSVATLSYSFLGGPRINLRPAFVHALVGMDYLQGVGPGIAASEKSLAAAFGGGAQWDIASRWAVSGSADYVLTRHSMLAAVGVPSAMAMQHNIRVSGGVVFKLGRLITE
jgi:hypothetical protein